MAIIDIAIGVEDVTVCPISDRHIGRGRLQDNMGVRASVTEAVDGRSAYARNRPWREFDRDLGT
jgi:hypothetical protein